MENIDTKFHISRSASINAYSNLEFWQANLLHIITGTDQKTAWKIFYRFANARGRYALIEELLKEEPRSKYIKSWDVICSWLRRLDATRNKIVHWSAVDHVIHEGKKHQLMLAHPSSFKPHEETEYIDHEQMVDFIVEASRVKDILKLLGDCIIDEKGGKASSCSQIFLQLTKRHTPEQTLKSLKSVDNSSQPQSLPQ